MFDKIATRIQSFVLIALVTLLSAVFVLQFGGPQAEGCTAGGSTYAARVAGSTINVGEVRSVFFTLGFNRSPVEQQRRDRLWRAVLDGLIERRLLAEEARKLGYRVTEDDVADRLANEGKIRISLGIEAPYPGGELDVGPQVRDRNDQYDPERARNFIQHDLRRSVGEFMQSQIEEALAERMRQTVLSGVEVSDAEVWDAFVRERERARIEYVRFSPGFYRERLDPTPDELDAWIAANAEPVDAAYQRDRARYSNLEPQVRARHILFRIAADASDEVRAETRRRASDALRRLRGGADFATLARELSEEAETARAGGDIGFVPRGRRSAAFDDAQFALEPGQLSDLVETPLGLHIIRVEAKREGDVPEAEAKRELAVPLYQAERGAALAREAAEATLAELRGGKTREELDAWLRAQARGEDAPAEPDETAPMDDGPRVQESRSFGRTDNPITGPFDAAPLVRDVFERTLEDAYPEAPIQLGNDFFVYRLVERTEATRADLEDEVRQRLREGLLRSKREEALTSYVREIRDRAQRAGRIRIRGVDLRVRAEGSGEVSSDPPGISCGRDCSASYEFGEMIQLTARPTGGARFAGWEGACGGSEPICIVALDEERNVTARFRGGDAPSGGMRTESAMALPTPDPEAPPPSDDE